MHIGHDKATIVVEVSQHAKRCGAFAVAVAPLASGCLRERH